MLGILAGGGGGGGGGGGREEEVYQSVSVSIFASVLSLDVQTVLRTLGTEVVNLVVVFMHC